MSSPPQIKAKPHGEAGWDRSLLIPILFGVVIIILFGFEMDRDPFGLKLKHWQSWELGALLWTAVFALYYAFKFPFVQTDLINRLVNLCVLVVLPVLAFTGGYFLLVSPKHFWHVLAVLAIGVLLLATDFLLYKYHVGEQKKAFLECVLIADVPVVCAFLVLLPYVFLHEHEEEREVFFSGAVSFQLIVSNILFILIQLGVVRKIWAVTMVAPAAAAPANTDRAGS